METDIKYMAFALHLARIGYGFTWPNPAVGAVVVKNGRIVGVGYHRKKGEDHAEVLAIKDARGLTEGATMYVTLEPHSFYGLVPPCTDAIIKAGIKRVVVAMLDPNPKVSGDGVRILRENGIEVTVGILEKEARFLNRFFYKFHKHKKPYVILKLAISMDGFVADSNGNSRWISNEQSRKMVHKMRGEVDAIMVGRRTLVIDNAKLTPRHVFPARMPVRIVCGRNFTKQSFNLDFFKENGEKWILTSNKASIRDLPPHVKLIRCGNESVDFHCLLDYMREREMLSLLVEGGPQLASSLMEQDIVDEIILFKSPKILGNGIPMFSVNKGKSLMENFYLHEAQEIEGDVMLRYIKNGTLD